MENNLTPEQVVEKINAMFAEKMCNVPTEDDFAELKGQIADLKSYMTGEEAQTEQEENRVAEIEKALAKFEGKLEAVSERGLQPRKNKSAKKSIVDAITKNFDGIKTAVKNGSKLTLELKDTTITGSYNGDYALTDFDPTVDRIARVRPTIMSVSNTGVTSSKFVTYISQTTESGSKWTEESEPKTIQNPKWKEISEEVKKIAGFVKISKEMLEDLSFIQSEVNTDLMEALATDIDNALINGAGGTQVIGILNQGIATFSAGSFALAIPFANISDVIRIAKAQVESTNFMATHVLLNPEDVAKIHLTKSSTGEYTYPMFIPMNGEMKVAELTVIVSNNISQDTYVVGDFSKFNIRMRNNMALTVGLDQDDFTRNMLTILAESRLVSYVKENCKTAFVTGTLSTDIASITAP